MDTLAIIVRRELAAAESLCVKSRRALALKAAVLTDHYAVDVGDGIGVQAVKYAVVVV